ncbi:LysR family transcriptional regulator [Lacibacterium aquatile]|uniref:LysR family transcriptional regulator n=1 Tax=Lacibacterium aquatile TaxID=1168082 RepID=A0ABW5DUC9_9PROT
MELQDLSMFVAVAEVGSFSEAARRLGVTPSAVSKGVARLESGLGVRLLARSTRQVGLTREGMAFRDRCRPILADLNEARDEVLSAGTAPAGRLRISLPTALSQRKIIRALPVFLKRYPAIHLDISTNDRPVDLIAEGVDIAVRVGEMADSSLVIRRLGRPPYATCASPDYFAEYGIPQTVEDLADHQCLGRFVDHVGRVRSWCFRQEGREMDWEPVGAITIDRAEGLGIAALHGLGIIQVNRYIVEEDIAAGRLVEVLKDFAPAGSPLQVVLPPGRQNVPRVRVFVDFLVELFADCDVAD